MSESVVNKKVEELEETMSIYINCIYSFKNLLYFLMKLNAVAEYEQVEKMCDEFLNKIDEKTIELINLKKEEI